MNKYQASASIIEIVGRAMDRYAEPEKDSIMSAEEYAEYNDRHRLRYQNDALFNARVNAAVANIMHVIEGLD